MRQNRHNISFRLDNRRDRNGEVAIMMVLTFCSRRVTVSTGVRLVPEYWDAKAMRPKKTATNHEQMTAMEIIAVITAKANVLEEVYSSIPAPTTETIRAEYRRRVSPGTMATETRPAQDRAGMDDSLRRGDVPAPRVDRRHPREIRSAGQPHRCCRSEDDLRRPGRTGADPSLGALPVHDYAGWLCRDEELYHRQAVRLPWLVFELGNEEGHKPQHGLQDLRPCAKADPKEGHLSGR